MSDTQINVTNEAPEAQKFLQDSAVLLAALTGVGYTIAFVYELGYCKYFNIPTMMVSPTPSVIIISILALVTVLFLLLQLASFESLFFGSLPLTFRLNLAFSIVLMGSALATFGFSWSALAAVSYIIFITFGSYIPVFFEKGTFTERLAAVDAAPSYMERHNPIRAISKTIGSGSILAFMACLLLLTIAHALGAAAARTQKDFHIMTSRPDVAIVRAYGDVVVAIRFDEAKKTASGEVLLFKLGEEVDQIGGVTKRIGPLKGSNPAAFFDLDVFK